MDVGNQRFPELAYAFIHDPIRDIFVIERGLELAQDLCALLGTGLVTFPHRLYIARCEDHGKAILEIFLVSWVVHEQYHGLHILRGTNHWKISTRFEKCASHSGFMRYGL
jgi:hypothetical protein